MTLYLSLVYSLLYLIFFAYPYAFGTVRGWSPRIAALPFAAIILGVAIGCMVSVWDTTTRFSRALAASGKQTLPEARLPPMMLGSIILPVGLFCEWIFLIWTSLVKHQSRVNRSTLAVLLRVQLSRADSHSRVRLDILAPHLLGSPSPQRHLHWRWYLPCLHARHGLHHGLLSTSCQ